MLVPRAVPQCVAYACSRPRPDRLEPRGTTFFLATPAGFPEGHPEHRRMTFWHVTANHVVAAAREHGDGLVHIAANTPTGTQVVTIPDEQWIQADQSYGVVDVAIAPSTWTSETATLRALRVQDMLTDQLAASEDIGVGDDLFMTGLFTRVPGAERLQPVVRVGSIAAMPGEPVPTKYGPTRAYLIEARSTGGLSGSPVFVALGPTRWNENGRVIPRPASRGWYLLGVAHGHFDEPGLGEGAEKVNMGLAVVTPISAVLELLRSDAAQARLAAARAAFEGRQTRD